MAYFMPIGTIVQPSTSIVVPPNAGRAGTFTLTPIGVPPSAALPGKLPTGPGSNLSVSEPFAAIGELIVYRDANHDGIPNLGSFGTGDGESVVGASSTYFNAYGSLVNSVSYGVTFAFHDDDTYDIPYLAGYHAFQDITDWDAFPTRTNLEEGAEILVRLGSDPGVRGLSCVENCFDVVSDAACPATIPELPTGGKGTCHPVGEPKPPNGRPSTTAAYTWELNTCNACRCTLQECAYQRAPGAPAPAGWPCDGVGAK
jgi:hypothetical protein